HWYGSTRGQHTPAYHEDGLHVLVIQVDRVSQTRLQQTLSDQCPRGRSNHKGHSPSTCHPNSRLYRPEAAIGQCTRSRLKLVFFAAQNCTTHIRSAAHTS